MAKKPAATPDVVEISPITLGGATIDLIGDTPLIMHRYATKAWHELLLPSLKKNAAAKATDLKHDPLEEFRQCGYRNRDDDRPTLFHFPSGAFSKAIASAAIDIPGAKKAQILRLVSLEDVQVDIYGIPSLGMDMVRSSDMARTPDVRTRMFFREWCCRINVSFVSSLITQLQIVNLVGAAGIIVGLGDYRPQKGGQHGKFRAVAADDPRLLHIKKQGRAAQQAAWQAPSFYNDDSAELYSWFTAEVERREKTLPSSTNDGLSVELPKAPKARKNGAGARASAV